MTRIRAKTIFLILLISISPFSSADILLLHADYPDEALAVKTALENTGLLDKIDILDVMIETPTLEKLKSYSAVFVYTNWVPPDGAALGNLLADYMDGGGALLVSTYSFSAPWEIGGRLQDDGYCPLVNQGMNGDPGRTLNAVVDDPIFEGVDLPHVLDFTNSNYALPALDAEATLLADNGAGVNMIARNASGQIIGVNIYPGYNVNAQAARLFANALLSVQQKFWSMPLTAPTIQQDFDCYDCIGTGKFHVGLDMTSGSPTVRAARHGIIQNIILTQDKTNAWCDGTDSDLSKLSTENQNFGNVLIIKHQIDSDHPPLYTQYAHLNCISREIGERFIDSISSGEPASIQKGEYIGDMGGSGKSSLTYWPTHLHFEIKTFGTLSTGNSYGYTDSLAENLGYLDPMLYIHQGRITEEPNRLSVILENDINVRVGPDKYDHADLIPNQLNAGTQVVIKRTATTATGKWYQVNLALPEESYSQGSGKNMNWDNNSPEGWIHSDYVAPYYGFVATINGSSGTLFDVYDASKKTTVAKVVGGQTYPVLGKVQATAKEKKLCVGDWVEIGLGEVNVSPGVTTVSGWICGSSVSEAGN